MNRQEVLNKLDKARFYHELVPSLKINGKPEALGLCPFHNDTNPSLSVNTETGLYFCPVCNEGGDIFKFYMRLKRVDFKEALGQLSEYSDVRTAEAEKIPRKIESVYQYTDETGKLLFEVVRFVQKTFRQRRPDGKGGYIYNIDGVRIVLYNLPKVIASDILFICEGEKDCDNLAKLGLTATTNPQGAGKWREEFSQYLSGKNVIIICDNDEAGKRHGHDVAQKLNGHAKSIKLIKQLPGVPHKGDVSDWLKIAGNDKPKLLELAKDAPMWTSVTEVTEVTVTPENEIQVLNFPTDVFPMWLKTRVIEISNSIGIPCSVTGSIVLTIISTAIGNSIRVSPKASFEVPPFLWTCIVMPTGSGKSPMLDVLTRPVKYKQAAAYQRYKNDLKQYQLNFRSFKKSEIDEIPDEPAHEQYLVQDTTVEALSTAFESQPRGLLSMQDELSGWLLGMNQYKSSGNDRQLYLQLFNASTWAINRKSGVKFIPSTGLGIIGNIQPETIPLVFRQETFMDGLIQRLLFVYPNTPPMKFSRESIGDLLLWNDLVDWCYQIPITTDESGFVVPKILKLEGTALDIYETFYNECGNLAAVLPTPYRGFISKLFLYCLKFAGVLHVIAGFKEGAFSGVISEKTVTDAVSLTKFYLGQISLILKLYRKGTLKPLNEFQNKLIQILYSLQGKVKNGMLRLEKIVDGYNEGLPVHFHLTPEKVATILKNELGLFTQKSTGNHSYLIWEDEKLKKYFKQTVTTITQIVEKQKTAVTEVTVVTDDSRKISEEIPEVEYVEEISNV